MPILGVMRGKIGGSEKGSRKGRGMATIADVARLAAVSPMTVSRVINDGENVRGETREKVRAAIRELNYSPNFAARSLASADTVRIGLLYDNPSSAYLSELLLGVLEQSGKVGGEVVIERCDDADGVERAIGKLLAAGVDGVILPPPLCESKSARDQLDAANIPFILIAAGTSGNDRMSVGIDDYTAAYEMTTHLIELGHRNIAFIKGHPNQTASGLRHEGFVGAIRDAGLDPANMRAEQGYFTYQSGLAAAEAILIGPDRPTAIFASNDDMAAAACAMAHRLALDVPKDISVVGFDDTPLAVTVYPELTTIRQPIAAMARTAVDLLARHIRAVRQEQRTDPHYEEMQYVLVRRGSSAAVKKRKS